MRAIEILDIDWWLIYLQPTSNESNGSQPKPPDEKEDKNEGDQDGDFSTSAQN